MILGISGCFGPLDLTGRSCPCDLGWTCTEGLCEMGMDAGRDASLPDASPDVEDSLGGDVPSAVDAPLDTPVRDAFEPADAPDSEACPVGALVCDDFESGAANRVPPWGFSSVTVARQSAPDAHGGSGLARFAVDGPGAERQIGFRLDPSVTDVWVQGYVRVASGTVHGDVGLVVVVGSPPDFPNNTFGLDSEGFGIYSTQANEGWGHAPLIPDTWTCFVYHLRIGVEGFVEALTSPGAVIRSTVFDSTFSDGMFGLGLGITFVGSTQGPFEVFYDDVVVTADGTGLACP